MAEKMLVARKIVQIAESQAGAENGYCRHILALADDGTLWEREVSIPNAPMEWKQVEGLPAREDTIDF